MGGKVVVVLAEFARRCLGSWRWGFEHMGLDQLGMEQLFR